MLDEIFARQLQLQRDSFGIDPHSIDGDDRWAYVLVNFEAIADELSEMRDHVHWKSWTHQAEPRGSFKDRDAFVDESVDLLHFLVNLWLVAGADAREIAMRYMGKASVNEWRQQNGYVGSHGDDA